MAIRSDVTIDWSVSPRLLTVLADSTAITIQEIVDTCRFLEDSEEGINYEFLIDAAGKEALGGTTSVGITATLNNAQIAFEARSGPLWVLCTISGGNIVAVDALGASLDPRYPTAFVSVDRAASSSATLIEDADTDAALIADAVWDEDVSDHVVNKSAALALKAGTYEGFISIDSVKGVAGTGWPIGTHYQPVNNLTDALAIMSRGNVDRLMVHTDLIIDSTSDVSNIVIETEGKMGTMVTFEAGCRADKTAFRYINLQGELTNGDELLVENCSVANLENFTGIMNNVALSQGSELIIGLWATIIQATSGGDPTNEPEINIGSASVNISQYSGNLKLIGKTGSNRTVVNCDSGNILIASSCVAGTIQLLGTGVIESDDSGVGCTVDSDGFLSVFNITDETLTNQEYMLKIINNKKELKKTAGVWELIIYDDDSSTPIMKKDIKDKDGNNITDIEAGVLAQELKTDV